MALPLSVSTVFLHDLDLGQTLELLASAGYQGVEWRCREIPPAAREQPTSNWGRHTFDCNPDWLAANGAALGKATRDAGLAVVALAPNVGADNLEAIRKLADGAAAAGCPLVRIGAPSAFTARTAAAYHDLYRQAADAYARVVELFEPRGLRCVIETHPATLFTSASLAVRMAMEFSPRQMGIILDLQNAPEEGYELPRLVVSLLGPYLAHVHAGGRRWVEQGPGPDGFGVRWACERCRLSAGVLDLPAVLADLLRAGYAGFVSLEDFRSEDNRVKVREGLADLRVAEAVARRRLAEPAAA